VSNGAILIVDDDEDIVETLTMVLADAGYSVVTANNGEGALAHLRRGLRPSLILLDLMMPVMNGWQLHELLTADPMFGTVPVVAISGDGSIQRKAPQVGAVAWLRKPFDLAELLETVRRYAATSASP
jgi:two-component system response regulator MprA